MRSACGVLGLLALCGVAWTEDGILVVHVSDLNERPINGVQLAAIGSSTGPPTAAGTTRIRLAPGIRPGHWVTLQIVAHRQGKDLVFVSPWDSRVPVPSFESGPDNFARVWLAEAGSKTLVQDGRGVASITAQYLARTAPQAGQEAIKVHREAVLAELARKHGLQPADIDAAVQAWAMKTKDPYQLGLAALYAQNYAQAAQLLSKSLQENETDYVNNAVFLGQALYREGDYVRAAEAYRKAKALRAEDPDILDGLGVALYALGQYSEAEPLYYRALRIREESLGSDHPAVARSLNNLEWLYQRNGQLKEAERLAERALLICEKALGPDHPEVATLQNNLASVLQAERKYERAEALYQRALEVLEKKLGPDHPDVAAALNNLASLYEEQVRYEDAEPLYQRALRILEKALGPYHAYVATTANNLGVLYFHQRKYTEAESFLHRALQVGERALGPNHPEIGAWLNNLANLYAVQGEDSEAEPRYREALRIFAEALDPDHPEVAATMYSLGKLYERQGKYGEAEPLYIRALGICEKVFGLDDRRTVETRERLDKLRARRSSTPQP